ncbi:MAG: DNA recombination protein RmuC [Dehalococcoidia bacterium]|nr:MAG: DNA recombination protein RmuC [Dehalococcoidia bacterium]
MEMLITVAFLVFGGLLLLLVGFLLWDRLRQGQRWQQQGDALSKAVGDRIDGTIKVFGELQKGIGELAEKAKGIEEAGKNILTLQEILRTPKPRGGLGEFLLERLLADSLPRDVYALQWRFHSGETVDAVVRIGGSMVPIDAKFPLEDFERMAAAESDEERAAIRKQFARTVKKHIDDVAKYIRPDENTFDFALMYVPAENIYYETILQPDIYSECLEKRVFLVSPNSFNAYLQAIVLGLRGLRIERATREILGRLQRLQGEFGSFQRDYETLGGHIHRAAAKYDEASFRLTRLGDKLQLTGEAAPRELPEGDEETSSQPE